MSAHDSTSSLDARMAQAISHHQAGQLDQAQLEYEAVLTAEPKHALALHNRGLLLGQLGRHREGVAELRRAVQQAPDEGEFWLSLARGLLQAGQPDEALDIAEHVQGRGYQGDSVEQLLRQARAALPQQPSERETRHIVELYQAGRYPDMEQATRALLARYPESTFGWSVLGTALQCQGKDALEALQRLVQLAPHDAEAHTHLGDALQNAGRVQDSLASYLRAIELAPRHAPAHCNLGSALDALGRRAEAQESYRRAIAADPAHLAAHFNLGNSLREAGRYDEAIASYRAALALAPGDPQLLTYLADTLRAQHRYDEALQLYRQVLDLLPELGEAWANLGTTLQSAGDLDGAVDAQLRALELDPGLNALHANLALALHALGRNDEAEQQHRLALALTPDDAVLHHGLADLLFKRGEYASSLEHCEQAIALAPGHPEHYFLQGAILHGLGQYQAAAESYRHVLRLAPEHAQARFNLAIMHQELTQYDQALLEYRLGLELAPDAADGYANMGVALDRMGRHEEAMAAQLRALELDPDLVLAHANISSLLTRDGQHEAAISHAEQALAQRPDMHAARHNLVSSLLALERNQEALEQCLLTMEQVTPTAEAYFDLGNCYRALGQPQAALDSFRKAVALKPDYAAAHTSMVPLLLDMGLLDEAVQSSRAAVDADPGSPLLLSNLLFVLSHASTDANQLFEEHCRFGDRFEAALRPHWTAHANAADPDKVLRIGFVSGDFNYHAVTNFFEPIAVLLAREPSLELHAFYNKTLEDPATVRLRKSFSQWHNITGMADTEAADLVRAQGIDILIDLAGHSAANRLPLFAHRPAPIQASWLGYPGTTGLLGVDYYLSDALRLPEGRYDNLFTEHIVRLPLSAPFLPESYAPPIHPLPALKNGHLTFGSFNRANKLSREVVQLWARVLCALPDARMLLAGLGEGHAYDALLGWFDEAGVARERLDLLPRCGMRDYLELHNRVDVALNPFPYTGATSLLHALWMGVPTLTMSGPTIPSHGGASYLAHLGLDAFVTEDPDLFVKRAVFLSHNIPVLAALRISLRERFNASVVGHPEVAAGGLERAFRIMWQRWCAGIAPGPIRVDLEDILPPPAP
ncbi:tetratricopeptide repeat protein [Oxalobacteraceae bacterium A2-2]